MGNTTVVSFKVEPRHFVVLKALAAVRQLSMSEFLREAVVYALDQLLMDAAKFNDYVAGSSSEKKSQVFDQLERMRKLWGAKAGVGYGTLRAGVINLDFQEKSD